ncbi:SMP-30/gluconolactonase/LRE family protein [Mameliella alba]|nr:SMP-30/gluconolactonase/LRE family protein [Antarctobacter heliothermus]MBY6143426.1 SMP-30/gluconolactonase/LRE family protein [Mameliella alba]MCA0952850.1 SMP-30/gluconolactonase/LRE family protein [Mameliella alba]
MAIEITCVADTHSQVGEGAVWDDRAQCLWWVDIPAGLVHRFDPATGQNLSYDMGEPVGCLALREAGGLVLALKSGFWFFEPETGARRPIHDPEAQLPDNRFNDGATDAQGRFWAGTMKDGGDPEPQGSFYWLDSDGSVTFWRGGYYTTNGLAFSPDGGRMYLSDSYAGVRKIWVCDYDIDTGTPGVPELFFDTRDVAGRPDGGTVDAEGCYWQAGVSGWQLYRLSPEGEVLLTIDMPVEKPSKPMFGGRGLDTLYVTSLGVGLDETRAQPQAGGLFAITGLGIKGLPQTRFQG